MRFYLLNNEKIQIIQRKIVEQYISRDGVFILFLPVHIYMAVFNSVYGKSGAMDSIFSGYRWIDKK